MKADSQQVKLTVILEDYLKKATRIKESTKKLLERGWDYMVKATGDIELSKFGFTEAERYQAYLLEAGMNKTTANIYVKAVRPVFSRLVKKGDLDESPFKHIRLFKVPVGEIRIFREHEIQAMLNISSDIWKARIWAGLAGLRIGEVLNLTFEDIDFDQAIIKIQPKQESLMIWAWEPKDIDRRLAPLYPELHNLLVSKIIPSLPNGQPYVMLTADRYLHLQWRRRQGKMTNRMRCCPDGRYCRCFAAILRKSGIKNGDFHDLRRTAITKWLSTLQVQEVQGLAGHANTETTLRYYYAADNVAIANKARHIKMCSS